jgi:hypothetical protein
MVVIHRSSRDLGHAAQNLRDRVGAAGGRTVACGRLVLPSGFNRRDRKRRAALRHPLAAGRVPVRPFQTSRRRARGGLSVCREKKRTVNLFADSRIVTLHVSGRLGEDEANPKSVAREPVAA